MRLDLTRRTDYAVRAMLGLARAPAVQQSGGQLAARTEIPVRFVTQVMGDLVRAGLVDARVGRAGGYRLRRQPETITILEIVEAVEGDNRRRRCVIRGRPCGLAEPCEVHDVFAGAQDALIERLAAASLSSILERGASA